MKIFLNKICWLLIFINFIYAYAASDFIIKADQKVKINGSKNTLKECLGENTKQAINFTTQLCALMGKIKIEFADNVEKFCSMRQLGQMQKNDGHIQVHLSSIQKSFTILVENLIDNKGYFKKASRDNLCEMITQIKGINSSLQDQIKKFEQLNNAVELPAKLKEVSAKIFAQFQLSAKELSDVQNKVEDLKCLKKS